MKTDALHATLRGTIGAMAMSGMREFTYYLGLVDETPPQRLARLSARGLMKKVPRKRRPAAIEALHWSVGALGGLIYGLVPQSLRKTPLSGPVYGVLIWVGFDTAIGPLLGAKRGDWPKHRERAALIADHLLYGYVLSETRSQPRE
jgi:hypothetical protein